MRLSRGLLIVLALTVSAVVAAEPTHRDHRQTALAAFHRADYAAAAAAFEAALALRPDAPRYWYNLAIARLRNREPEAALTALTRFASLGALLPVASEEEFAPLRTDPRFSVVTETLARLSEPRGAATLAFTLPAQTGIIEGLGFRRATGDVFFGDVHHRCVWRRDAQGKITRFSPAGEVLFGVFNLAVDESRQRLWLATSMLAQSAGFTAADEGRAAIVALDLNTGAIVETFPVPPDGHNHVLGDLTLAADGTLYVTDSTASTLWRLAPDARTLDPFLTSTALVSLQGLALVADGQKLIVADYANGLFVIDLTSRVFTPIPPVPNATLLGIDGLVASGPHLYAVQNGIEPQRVLRLTLSPAADSIIDRETLAASLPGFDDLTLITLLDRQPHVIAASGWALVDDKSTALAAHDVSVFALSAP